MPSGDRARPRRPMQPHCRALSWRLTEALPPPVISDQRALRGLPRASGHSFERPLTWAGVRVPHQEPVHVASFPGDQLFSRLPPRPLLLRKEPVWP